MFQEEPILGFNEIGDEKNLIIDESSHKAPKLDFTSLDPHIEETAEIQTQAQIEDFIKTQFHGQQVEAMKVFILNMICVIFPVVNMTTKYLPNSIIFINSIK